MNNLNQNTVVSILEVITYFDMFDFPLTENEILRYMRERTDFIYLQTILERLEEKKIIERTNGLYHLKGRSDNVRIRMQRYNYSNRKIKKAKFISNIIKFVPWIRMIAVGNIMGVQNLRDGSDIDLFIVTTKRRVWVSRLLVVAVVKIFGMRPTTKKSKDQICLSFYIDESSLNLEKMRKSSSDYYFVYWLACLVPLYSDKKIYQNFMKANSWIINELPNFEIPAYSFRRVDQNGFSQFYRDLADVFVGGLERKIKAMQIGIMPKILIEKAKFSTDVILGNHIIKLHSNDRRDQFIKKYNKRFSNLLSNLV